MRTRGKRWRRLATAAVIAGSVTPAVLRWVRRAGASNRAVNMKMNVVVDRPVAEVFEFCRDFENFPEVINGLAEVKDTLDGRSHWKVLSPLGHAIEWDAAVTKYVPNTVIAWESVPGSPVEASGLMRFAPIDANSTRVDVTLTYLPRETNLAEAFSALLSGSNARKLRAEVEQASRTLQPR